MCITNETVTLEFVDIFSVDGSHLVERSFFHHSCSGLNEKCPTRAQLYEHLVYGPQ